MIENGGNVEAKDLREKIERLKEQVTELGKKVKDVVGKSGEWAEEHPGASIGIIAGVAASIGFILGLMAGRGKD